MNEDIRKNIVDESGKNSDNIVDIEAFAAEYEADADFENLIKNGLDESWEDLGISVSDDLIARTMDSIRNADEKAKAFPSDETPAKTATTVTAAEPAKTRSTKYRRFVRIAAGIAAAALIGIFGIGVLKSGLFFSKKSADSSAKSEANSNSAPMSMAANNGDSFKEKTSGAKSDDYSSASETIMDAIASDNEFDGYFTDDQQITSAAGTSTADLGSANYTVTENVAPMATAVPDFTLDNGNTKTMEPRGTDSTDTTEDVTDESDIDAGYTEDPAYAPALDGDGLDADGFTKTETAYLDIDAVLLDTDEEEKAQSIIEYIESVRGELLDAAVDTSYPEDMDAILFSAVWPETDEEPFGLYTRCDIYDDRVVYSQFSVLDHIAPDFTVEEYMLENGEAVAAELLRLSGEAAE